MATFSADFEIIGNGSYVNEPVIFNAASTVGNVPADASVVGEVEASEIDFNNYTVTKIVKYQWQTSDGYFYSGDTTTHNFENSGMYQMTLTVWSEAFLLPDGRKFHFTHSQFRDIEIKSRFLKLLKDSNPTYGLVQNQGLDDFYEAASKFFERIYVDTGGIFDLWDAERIPPEYFEYLALTLGHDGEYSQKVGYRTESGDDFSNYSIYDKIRNKSATNDEIRAFRRFLLFSSELFRGKGTPDNIEEFLSFFSIDGKAVELWTENWGQTPIGLTQENFIGFDIEDNDLSLHWENVRAVGNCNEVGFVKKTLNSVVIDNYHKIEKVEHDADKVDETGAGWHEYELDESVPYVRGIWKENGEILVEPDAYQQEASVYDLVENNPVRFNPNKKSVLQINPEYIDYGDRLIVEYHKYPTDSNGLVITADSMLATREETVKDFDLNVKWRFISANDPNFNEAYRFPENELFVAFRGVPKDDDYYAHFNEYYRLSINGRRSTVSLTKIIQGESNQDVINQKINLSGDKENPVYDKVIILPETATECSDTTTTTNDCEVASFSENVFYELKVSVNGSLVSAWVRENDVDTTIQQNYDSDRGGSDTSSESTKEWISLFENLSLDITDEQIMALDNDGNDVISTKYTYINTGGNYGIGCRNSITEIHEATLDVLDADTSLYTDAEKELNLQPKYLQWLGSEQIRFNNTRENNNSFTTTISESFDASQTDYTIDDAQSLEYVFFNNAKVDEDIATRFCVTFDEDWMKDNFTNASDVLNRIIIPFGGQRSWFMPEQRSQNIDIYKNYYGTDSITNDVPGLFLYNESTVLDDYDTHPGDNFSSLRRTISRDEITYLFKFSERMNQYSTSGKFINYRGVFQETNPMSAYFPSIDGQYELPDGNNFRNNVFMPIVYESENAFRIIGIRFKNCDDIERIITNVSTDLHKDVQLYGQFTFTLPNEAVKFRPDRTTTLTSSTVANHYDVQVFLPLGVLSKETRNYSLGTEFLHDVQNSGVSDIKLNGVYFRIPPELTNYREDSQEIELFNEVQNPYEDSTLELYCNHYLSASVDLASPLQSFDYGTTFPTTYIIDKNVRLLIQEMAKRTIDSKYYADCSTQYSYENDIDWWLPSEVWLKRTVSKLATNYNRDIASNINYNISSSENKYFYDLKIPSGSSKPAALTYQITDGSVQANTMYYAKIKVNLQYMGFNWEDINQPDEPYNAIDREELRKLSVRGGKQPDYTDYRQSPVGTCMTFYVPFSWFPEGQTPTNNTIEWFNYIVGSYGEGSTAPSISITPIGLMTFLMNNSGEANRVQVDNETAFNANLLLNVTKDWSVSDWNKLFERNVSVEFVAQRVPSDKVKLFDKFVISQDLPTNVGSYIDVDYNVADSDSISWDVLDTFRIFIKSTNQRIFDVPNELKTIRSWILDNRGMSINNYIIPPTFYELVSDTVLTITATEALSIFNEATMRASWYYDIYFDEALIRTSKDEFNTSLAREIDWLPYETDGEVFSVTARRASTDLVFKSDDLTYDLVDVNGESSFKSINLNTALSVDYGKSGDFNVVTEDNVIQFSKDESSNIKKMYMIDDNNVVFDISTLVYFDPDLNDIKNYQGKKFELVLKATNAYDPIRQRNVVGGYYFLGIGTYNFDIALGVARYNTTTGKMDKSFLAGWGDYNVRGVKTGVWYNLRAIVTSDFIRVIFNERYDNSRMVLNYNINPLTQTDPNRYLSGEFEELVYLVTGLENLDITYPDKLSDKTSQRFFEDVWDESLVREYRPPGTNAGMVFYNDYTYVGKVEYKYQIQGDKVFGDTTDKTDNSDFIEQIRQTFGDDGEVKLITKTLSGNYVFHVGSNLYYKIFNRDVNLYDSNIDKVVVSRKDVIVKYNSTRRNDVIIVKEDFSTYRSIYVKDNTFHEDHLYKYLEYTNRDIKNIWVGDGKVHIEFCDEGDC